MIEIFGDLATIIGGSKYAFYIICILIFLAYALGKMILMGIFGAVMFGAIGYFLGGDTGMAIGVVLGMIGGIMGAMDELKQEMNNS